MVHRSRRVSAEESYTPLDRSGMTTTNLSARAESTDTAAIWTAYHARLRSFISSRVHDRNDAEDILQDVFLKTHARLADLNEETKLQSWLYQIARNAVTDYYRKRRPDIGDEFNAEAVADSEEGTRNALHELAECLRPMIESLPPHYRDALVLAELDGLTQNEIARREGISVSGAKSRVQRGRAMLKDLLDECCRFAFDQRGHVIGYESKACDDDCGDCD